MRSRGWISILLLVGACDHRQEAVLRRVQHIQSRPPVRIEPLPSFRVKNPSQPSCRGRLGQTHHHGWAKTRLTTRNIFSSLPMRESDDSTTPRQWWWQNVSWKQLKWVGMLSEPHHKGALVTLNGKKIVCVRVGDRIGKQALSIISINEKRLQMVYHDKNGKRRAANWLWQGQLDA